VVVRVDGGETHGKTPKLHKGGQNPKVISTCRKVISLLVLSLAKFMAKLQDSRVNVDPRETQ
jgi:hypothetical protein